MKLIRVLSNKSIKDLMDNEKYHFPSAKAFLKHLGLELNALHFIAKEGPEQFLVFSTVDIEKFIQDFLENQAAPAGTIGEAHEN